MSACTQSGQLEAAVLGELPVAVTREMGMHAQHCARCRHELNWLETERSLFHQRAGRDEVAHLWANFEAKNAPVESRVGWQWVMGLAALLVLSLGLIGSRVNSAAQTPADGFAAESFLESSPLMSLSVDFAPEEPCSRLPSGMGFQCGPALPASFVAMR